MGEPNPNPNRSPISSPTNDWTKTREAAKTKIDDLASDLNEISRQIWSHPELNFEEFHAHKVLTEFLEKQGFQVTRNYHLDTAFKATYGSDGIHVCVICEYDALPDIGHACGHNLIAECGVAAGLGIKAALDLPDNSPIGKVTILGTPAEEGGGGKIKLIEAGALQGVDVAMMAHPFQRNISRPVCLAVVTMTVGFKGQAAHAAASPWQGVNALDAAVMFYSNVSVMRQQFKQEWRVHGTFMKGGGVPSIIPEESEVMFYLRTADNKDMPILKKKIIGCALGAATATGCEVEYSFGGDYANMVTNPVLASVYERRASSLGVDYTTSEVTFSTDMGDVSHEVPSIHIMYEIGTGESNHSRAFADAAGAPEAQANTLIQAKAMALTALDLMQPGNEQLMKQIKTEFVAQVGQKN